MKITSIELIRTATRKIPFQDLESQSVCSWVASDDGFDAVNSDFKAQFCPDISYSLKVSFDERLDRSTLLQCILYLNKRKQEHTSCFASFDSINKNTSDQVLSPYYVAIELNNEDLYRSAIDVELLLDFHLKELGNEEDEIIISTGNFSFLVEQTNENASAMINYLDDEGIKYIFNKRSDSKDSSNLTATHHDPSLEVISKKLASLISAYDNSISFFKSNAYFNLKQEDRIEGFDKLRSFGSETLRFIVEHPDELTPYDSNSGINYKGRYYIPRHTLVSCNVKSYSIAENVIVVSFLHTLISDVKKIIKLIEENHSNYPQSFLRNLSLNKIEGLHNKPQALNLKQFKDYLKSLTKIYALYRSILPVEEIKVNKCPRPTPIFLSVPGYKILYTKIREWFSFEISTYGFNDFGLNALYQYQLFEYYSLVRIIKKLEEKGFTLIENRMFEDNYDECNCPKSDFNNQYIFDNEDNLTATLIYQPIIHSVKYNNIGLYRRLRSSISTDQLPNLPKNNTVVWDRPSTERYYKNFENSQLYDAYYTPDYLLCVTNRNTKITKYLIIDAKNKTPENVVDEDLMQLIFKYQLSIKPVKNTDILLGVDILCSKQQNATGIVNPFERVKNPLTNEIESSFVRFHILNPGKDFEDFELNENLFE